MDFLKADEGKLGAFEYIVIAKINRGLVAQVFIFDREIKCIERCLRMSEVRRVLVEKLVREAHFIVPIEDAVITEVWANPSMSIGTSMAINSLHCEL